eukprot:CAMPEP_0184681154 /NCGR_PEP_ID=MMETSP0312-20130426/4106_1 /TAXON_ID=31354 /ORGANISM="Compsopogon coeruleus, Strain SAG 36.94" /LENGTH=256 /DNA_ID=CAMNT_0027131789 /DNA_START=100 /DNA_END=870 /DNA_ORIENTATION=-
MAELRDYVVAESGAAKARESLVRMTLTHGNLQNTSFPELRLDRGEDVESLKMRIYRATGTRPGRMQLVMKTSKGNTVCRLEEGKTLGSYDPQDGFILHVEDVDEFSLSRGGWLDDTSLVDKYVMDEESYNKRAVSVRRFKEERQRALVEEAEGASQEGAVRELPQVGQRCVVSPGDRRGEVRYVGDDQGVGLGPGTWVGVRFDEPVGKNDGTIRGIRFFEDCPSRFGGVVRPSFVEVGDFPPEEFDLAAASDDDEI